jgi:hypothetical protein
VVWQSFLEWNRHTVENYFTTRLIIVDEHICFGDHSRRRVQSEVVHISLVGRENLGENHARPSKNDNVQVRKVMSGLNGNCNRFGY